MRTIAIGVPSGQAARDVLHSGVLERLAAAPGCRVVALTPAHDDPQLREELLRAGAEVAPLEAYRPTLAERCLRSAQLATLRHQCTTIDAHIRRGGSRGMKYSVPLVGLAERMMGRRQVARGLNWLNARAGRRRCASSLDGLNADLVVVTRVFNWSADYGLLKDAYAAGIPTVAVVSSWDNLTSKGFFPFGVHDIVVWNEIMRQEAMDLFDFPDGRIHICGIPRYDAFFRRADLRDHHTFCRSAGLDPQRRLVTFTSANTGLLSHPKNPHPEVDVVRFLADCVRHELFGEPAQLLVRLHPLADPSVFSAVAAMPHVHMQIPGRSAKFRDRLMSRDEDRLLGETLWHSDVVINHASTITIDAAVFDTPVVCIGFDWIPDQPYVGSARRLYDQDHYRKLAVTGGYHLAGSRDELVAAVGRYLREPRTDRSGRRAIVRQQCHFDDGCSAQRLSNLLLAKLGVPAASAGRAA